MDVDKEFLLNRYEYIDGRLYHRLSGSGISKGARAGCKVTSKPYRAVKIFGERWYEHRVIFLMHKGFLPKYVDHIKDDLNEDGIKSNLIDNLREITFSANLQKGSKRGSTSNYRGVCWKKSNRKWCAQIRYNRKEIHIGLFDCEIDAAIAYDKRASQIYGEHCGLNFPEDVSV